MFSGGHFVKILRIFFGSLPCLLSLFLGMGSLQSQEHVLKDEITQQIVKELSQAYYCRWGYKKWFACMIEPLCVDTQGYLRYKSALPETAGRYTFFPFKDFDYQTNTIRVIIESKIKVSRTQKFATKIPTEEVGWLKDDYTSCTFINNNKNDKIDQRLYLCNTRIPFELFIKMMPKKVKIQGDEL